jgi:putative oxidoreductase
MGPGGVAGFLGSSGVPLPGLAALLLIGVELVGGLVVMAGLLTRLTAAMQAFAMLVATALVHLPNGYFMPNGVEFSLTLMLASLALTLTGPGRYSVDAKLFGAEPLLALAPSRLRRAA